MKRMRGGGCGSPPEEEGACLPCQDWPSLGSLRCQGRLIAWRTTLGNFSFRNDLYSRWFLFSAHSEMRYRDQGELPQWKYGLEEKCSYDWQWLLPNGSMSDNCFLWHSFYFFYISQILWWENFKLWGKKNNSWWFLSLRLWVHNETNDKNWLIIVARESTLYSAFPLLTVHWGPHSGWKKTCLYSNILTNKWRRKYGIMPFTTANELRGISRQGSMTYFLPLDYIVISVK